MKLLVLLTDAFGGHGGIAKFNRDFLHALCSYPETTGALPRVISNPLGPLAPRLKYAMPESAPCG